MVKRALILFFYQVALMVIAVPAGAQTDPVSCTITPRNATEIDALSQSESSPPPRKAIPFPIAGDPVDEETHQVILQTLLLVDQCTREGDLMKVLALYTDAYISSQLLADSGALIVPAVLGSDVTGTAVPDDPDQTPVLADVRRQQDGSLIAVVTNPAAGNRTELVRFVESDSGQWQIDQIEMIAVGTPEASPVAADPAAEITSILITVVAEASGVAGDDIEVVSVEAVEWPSSALGCEEEGGVYLTVITPGFRIVLQAGDEEFEYHTDMDGHFVTC